MPTCTICTLEKADEAFRLFKHKGGERRRSECIECEVIIKARRKDNSTFVEKALQVPVNSLPKPPTSLADRLAMAVEVRMEFYKQSGLDALYDLATMPMPDNSAMAQVKFMAASRLAGPIEGVQERGSGPTFDSVLQQLNERFHANAPKIRSIRERTVQFDDGSQTRVIESPAA